MFSEITTSFNERFTAPPELVLLEFAGSKLSFRLLFSRYNLTLQEIAAIFEAPSDYDDEEDDVRSEEIQDYQDSSNRWSRD
ncbi:hypothetical protein E2C01_017205 [Portunus trituberculatus]|uniref:Uncharacterized protein n=1 Tax=Portunus trituberculatus TaxID=210409 RepID=A0A5B7DSZ3_PORTR|nr:hypothetical protein [Portunus trituberculatus]